MYKKNTFTTMPVSTATFFFVLINRWLPFCASPSPLVKIHRNFFFNLPASAFPARAIQAEHHHLAIHAIHVSML